MKPDGKSFGLLRELRWIVQQLRRMWELLPARRRLTLAGASLIMFVAGAAGTAVPLLLGRLLDVMRTGIDKGVASQALYQWLWIYLALIAGAYIVRETLQVVRRFFVEDACTRIERDLTCRLIGHLMRVDLNSLGAEKVGALNGRISRSVVGSVRFIRLAFLDLLPVVLSGSLALIAALSKQPWLGLAMLGAVPVGLILTLRQLASQKGVRLELIRSREDMDGIVVELLGGMDYVRAANTHEDEMRRLDAAVEERRAKELRHHNEMSFFGSGKALNEGLFHVLVLGLAIYLAVQGQISIGDILSLSILFVSVMAPLSEVHRAVDEGHECSLQVGNLMEMLAEPGDRSFHVADAQKPEPRLGEPIITAHGLCVEYCTASRQRRRVLDGVQVAIRHGQTIGVAGRSGSGKTTWLRLLMRLTHPAAGSLRLAGVPIEHVSREEIGRLIGYVGQSPFVFTGSIAENIAYGTGVSSKETIERAARMAHIHDEILAMPRGYDTLITERGGNLSGGQRQRVALARAFLKDPPILILDEGTSALDSISELHIQNALAEARVERTVLLVAHRLSTLIDTDSILVFDQGRIVESGAYEELVRRNGVFADLVRSASGGEVNGVAARRVRRLKTVVSC
jgi:ATP-binding cassette subfamily B protein